MAAHFYPLTVKAVQRETPECVSILFDVPETLQQDFAFTQGQHLTLRAVIDGIEVRRNYSLCSSPLDSEWRIAIKKADGGLFSHWANEYIKPGDLLEVMPPLGKFFTQLDPKHAKHYLAFAAGSGITPLMSIIQTTLRSEPGSKFTLVYGNRSSSSIIFQEQLENLRDKYLHRFSIHYILSGEATESPFNHGRIGREKCALLFEKLLRPDDISEVFICGPQAMTDEVKNFLEKAGFDKAHIHFELFNTDSKTGRAPIKPLSKPEATATMELTLDGRTSIVPVESGDTILEAALRQGFDLPYACRGGVCTTCRAKLTAGEVSMDVNYGLDDAEVTEGYILTCQSHPLTNTLAVNYDLR